jgi:two-component system, NarL family, nitrate/nitrite response regulator NarL
MPGMDGVSNPRSSITIVIAVAVRLYREGLASMLNAQKDLRIKAIAGTPLEAQAAVRKLQPDFVIVDTSLEDVHGLMRELRAESSTTRIIAFAVKEDITTILGFAQAGADGFVTANCSVADLVEAIQRTAAGELLCSPRIAAQLLRRAAHQAIHATDRTGGPVLTSRERQVFSLLKQGQSNKEIGAALNIAEATVKNHVHHLLEKLQVASRGQAAAVATQPIKVKSGLE